MDTTEIHDLTERIRSIEQSISNLQARIDIVVNQITALSNANVLSRHNSFHSELEIEIEEDVHCLLKFMRRITCGRF